MIKYVDKHDSLRLKQNNGIYEEQETKLFRRLLKSDSIFVDVGAHIGYYSDIASEIIKDGWIYAFEPWPENFKLLKKNVKKKFPSTLLSFCNAAVGSEGKTDFMYECKTNTGDHQAYESKIDKRESIETKFLRLDSALSTNKIDFLKIDTQGFEVEVLKGAKELIENSPDINILLEYSPHHLKLAGNSPGELIGLLVDIGLNIYVHTKKGWLYANSETFLLKHIGHINLFCSRKKYNEIDWSKN